MLRSTKATVIAIAIAALCGTTALAAATLQDLPADAPAQLKLTIDGPVLFTPTGMSLYMHSGENTKSERFAWQCTTAVQKTTNDGQSGIGERPQIGFKFLRSCLDKFRPYPADASAKPVGDFTIINRPDGSKQWAFKGFPLYLSEKDRRPFERNSAGRGGFGGGRGGGGMQSAAIPMTLPTGVQMVRRAEGLVLVTTADQRAVYTPKGGARVLQASVGREDFKPLVAPAVAIVSGDWSLIDSGTGFRQYAFKGKPLYAAPTSLNELEVAGVRSWEPVVVVKAPPVPVAISQHLTLNGHVYTTGKGMSLYTYNCNSGAATGPISTRATSVTCEDPGDPAAFMVALCGDGKECARRWKPYIAAPGAKAEGEFSIVDITYPMFTDIRGKLYPEDAPKVKAWAYRGKPLFTYYEDEKPGDMWGSSIGGIWGSTWGVVDVPGKSATFFEP